MPHPRFASAEIAERGQALFEQEIREKLEPSDHGKFLALDIETGFYELDLDQLAAVNRVRARHPEAALYLIRVGSRTAYRLGRKALVAAPA